VGNDSSFHQLFMFCRHSAADSPSYLQCLPLLLSLFGVCENYWYLLMCLFTAFERQRETGPYVKPLSSRHEILPIDKDMLYQELSESIGTSPVC